MPHLRPMTDADLPAVLELLAAAGSTARTSATWHADRMSALLLSPAPSSAPVAAMPFARRTLAVAPGRALNVGWISSNQFVSRMSLRRQTRATAPDWPQLLPDLDALLAVRRDESSMSARWYDQTGFAQILALRCLYLAMDRPPANPVGRYLAKVIAPDDLAPWQPHMLAVHREVFGAYGGIPLRHDNYWVHALAHHFYKEHYQFQIIGLWAPTAPETLMGYAVVGWSGWHSKRPRMDILELATRQWDATVAEELIRTTCQLAWSKSVHEVRAVISVHDPYRSHLGRTGFEDRWGYVLLAKWLHPQRYLDRLHTAVALPDLAVQLNAPGHVTLTLGTPALPATHTLRLQTDPATLTRLLLQRTEISAASHDGSLITLEGSTPALARLALSLPWTPWVFHMLDYI